MQNPVRISAYIASLVIGLSLSANAGLPGFDKDFSCIDQAKANQYVSDFSIDTGSFGGVELCDAKKDSKKLFNDLLLIEQGQFSKEAASNILIGGYVNSGNYYTWLKNETNGMNRGNDIPMATAYNRGGYFTMQDGWTVLSSLGRVGVVIHEARHSEGYRHIPCTFGPYSNVRMDGCDSSFGYGGSHAVEMEYYARVITQGTNFHPLYAKMARLMALGRSNFVFNAQVITKREGIYLISSDMSQSYLIDNGQLKAREFPRMTTANDFILKRSSFGATIFALGKGWGVDPYANYGDITPIEDGYSYYKLMLMGRGLPAGTKVREFEEYDVNSLRVAVAVTEQGQTASYNFGQGHWNDLKTPKVNPARLLTRLPSGETGLYFVDANNNMSRFDQSTQIDTPVTEKWNPSIRTVLAGNAKDLLMLGTDGVIRANGEAWPTTANLVFSQGVNIPLYNAFEVK